MTTKRYVCHQNLKDVAKGILSRAKNGDRAVFRQVHDKISHFEIEYSDVPFDGINYKKIIKHMPETLWGVYNTKMKVDVIVSDLTFKIKSTD